MSFIDIIVIIVVLLLCTDLRIDVTIVCISICILCQSMYIMAQMFFFLVCLSTPVVTEAKEELMRLRMLIKENVPSAEGKESETMMPGNY